VREQRRQVLADLPVATDLLAACLASGASPPAALATVGRAVGGALGSRLERLSSVLLLGADPAAAWRSLASHPELGRVARAVVRSLDTGAPVAPALERAARDLRARRRSTAEAAARAVAVKAVAPLGLCFLPAFLLVGIVPTVWGMAARTFAGLV
jgi:pilus assembly protein TadC